jgi:hypothetical protein
VTAIVTERGVARAPYGKSLAALKADGGKKAAPLRSARSRG